MRQNWGHAQRLLALAVLRHSGGSRQQNSSCMKLWLCQLLAVRLPVRPDWLRVFSLYAPQLRSAPSAWEQRRWQEALRRRTALLQQDVEMSNGIFQPLEFRLFPASVMKLDFFALRNFVFLWSAPPHGSACRASSP